MDVKTKPISVRERELLAMPPIAASLPAMFRDSGTGVEEYTGECAQCGKDISGSALRGQVVRCGDQTIQIEAIGVCLDCVLATTYLFRMYRDGRTAWLNGDQWVQQLAAQSKRHRILWTRALSALQAFLTRLSRMGS